MATFGVHVDKENSSQVHLLAPTRTSHISRGIVGKTFQGNNVIGHMPTPARKVLGDVNTGGHINIKDGLKKTAPAKSLFLLKPPAPTAKSNKSKVNKKQKSVVKPSEVKEETKLTVKPFSVHDDIENMPLPPEVEDDFEDIWPVAERPATYVEQLKAWRPSRLFPLYTSQDAGEESDNELLDLGCDDDPSPCKGPDLSLEEPEPDISPIPEPDFEVPLPSLDDFPLPVLEGLSESLDLYSRLY